MLRMSLINVAVKSGPPSARPLCGSVLVPLQRPQRQEQIVTLMMDMQPLPAHTTSRMVSGHCLSSARLSPLFSLGESGMANNHVQPISSERTADSLAY